MSGVKNPIIISIEGNIGSGKSTLVDRLKHLYQSKDDIFFLQEPVDTWNTITDENGITILEKYYENQEKYAFPFQMMAYISRISILRQAIKNSNAKVIITERCVFTDSNVFAKMLYDTKKIEPIEYCIYRKWFDEFVEDFPIKNVIYVKTDPSIALERVIKRNRLGETIPIEYLATCHQYHEDWLLGQDNISVLTLDGNTDTDESPAIIMDWLNEINRFIAKSINTNTNTITNNIFQKSSM